MNILILNHHFDQDIEEIYKENQKHKILVLSIKHFSSPAHNYFKKKIFSKLRYYWCNTKSIQRYLWKIRSIYLLKEIYYYFPFDLLITPSDSFFYIFDVIEYLKSANIQVHVLQKETSIAPYTMNTHSINIKKYAPFRSSNISVCSKRQKEFWERAGVSSNQITITGQPRFDYYARKNIFSDRSSYTITFFSFFLTAYVPTNEDENRSFDWIDLRSDIENVLVEIAQKYDNVNINIKPHPQQKLDDLKKTTLYKNLSKFNNLKLVSPDLDSRDLLFKSDLIIGFQSTILFEAAGLDLNVIYTAWGPEYKMIEEKLLPIYKIDCIIWAQSKELFKKKLINFIEKKNKIITHRNSELLNYYIGPFDGHSAQRFWEMIDDKYDHFTNKDRIKLNILEKSTIRMKYFYLKTFLFLDSVFQFKSNIFKNRIKNHDDLVQICLIEQNRLKIIHGTSYKTIIDIIIGLPFKL